MVKKERWYPRLYKNQAELENKEEPKNKILVVYTKQNVAKVIDFLKYKKNRGL